MEYRGLWESGPQKISKRNLLREKYCQINFICCCDITLSARMGCGVARMADGEEPDE